jgi:1,4-alpha-glucan branching enzyme
MIYEYSERFVMPLSHDEVVHGKGSLLRKMPGDDWQRFANLRAMLAYMYTRPGKKLLFMGTELAPDGEWNHDRGLEWSLTEDPRRGAFCNFVRELGQLYRATPALWQLDHEPAGFRWIDVADKQNSVVSYVRSDEEGAKLLVALNLTPAPRERYRLGVPESRGLKLAVSSDDRRWGGSGYPAIAAPVPEAMPFHGFEHSVELTLPPLSAVIYAIEPGEHPSTPAPGEEEPPRAPIDGLRTGPDAHT